MPQDDDLPSFSDRDLMDIMRRDDNPLSSAWRVFRREVAHLELLRHRMGTVELKHRECQAVMKIMRAAGVCIRKEEDWTDEDRRKAAEIEKRRK